jgi:hypothetical protein
VLVNKQNLSQNYIKDEGFTGIYQKSYVDLVLTLYNHLGLYITGIQLCTFFGPQGCKHPTHS